MIFGAILAAGSSSRLQSRKQLIEIDGKPLLEHIATRASAATRLRRVGVVVGAFAEEITRHGVIAEGISRIENPDWAEGIASSIRAAGQWAAGASDCDALMIMLCDQPHLSTAHLERLITAFENDDTRPVASAYSGVVGVPAIFPRRLFAELETLRGDQGARGVLKRHDALAVAWPEGAIDLDTPEAVRALTSKPGRREPQ